MSEKLLMVFLVFIVLLFPHDLVSAEEGGFGKEDLLMPASTVFLDRNGDILRFVPDSKGQRHIWLAGKDIPDIVRKAFIAAEDRRFYSHNGFDLPSILRAMKDNMLRGRIVSGASTITQQVVRLIYPHERTFREKLIEISRSARLEDLLSKDEIIEQYLNRVPLGNNIIGVELASRVYFGKPCAQLAPAEAALLASLPKAPGFLNPFGKNSAQLLKRKDRVLSEMSRLGYITEDELTAAQGYEIVFSKKAPFPNNAPHFVDMLTAKGMAGLGEHHTTIDINLQKEVEKKLLSHKERLLSKGAGQAAAIVIHNSTMEVLASVGSISYASRDGGYNNGTTALRSAGSTIKPFLYAEALEEGHTVSSLLEDTLRKYKTPFGNYSPDNFDRKEYGPVTMRTALGNSLNISAVKMLDSLDIEPVHATLRKVNLMDSSDIGAGKYGLGLVIGNIEVGLEQLVAAYAVFANGGTFRPLKYTLDDADIEPSEVFSKETAHIISDVLSDPSARILTFGGVSDMDFPFRVALKTGTSTKYRDGWAVGFTPEYTIGVWTGNFDGRPTASITGASGAVPIFRDIIQILYENGRPSSVSKPDNVVVREVCGISGMKPGPHCDYRTRELFISGTEPEHTCSLHNMERYIHELPATYAAWVYEKEKKASAGGYRLQGLSDNLEEVFKDESGSPDADIPRIRIRGGAVQRRGPEVADAVVLKKHYSIGTGGNSGHADQEHRNGNLSIIYPLPNDRFILDRNKDSQVIRLETVSDRPVKYVEWFIDGTHYATSGPPYHAYWKLEKGRHSLAAVAPDNRGDYIEIIVE